MQGQLAELMARQLRLKNDWPNGKSLENQSIYSTHPCRHRLQFFEPLVRVQSWADLWGKTSVDRAGGGELEEGSGRYFGRRRTMDNTRRMLAKWGFSFDKAYMSTCEISKPNTSTAELQGRLLPVKTFNCSSVDSLTIDDLKTDHFHGPWKTLTGTTTCPNTRVYHGVRR